MSIICHQINVLDLPNAPSPVSIKRNGNCFIKMFWRIPIPPTQTTAPIDQVYLEQRICSYDNITCCEEWKMLGIYPSNTQSANITLLPNKNYSFRLTSCSDLVGCGNPEIIQKTVNSSVKGNHSHLSLIFQCKFVCVCV